jgi:uncharacterized protein YdhG (YjbR/CyaY superfamily)
MFDEYLSAVPDEQRQALQVIVDQVATAAPDAAEGRSYGLPAFRYRGSPLLGFAVAKDHLSLYPFSPKVVEAVTPQLDGYKLSKGTIRFTVDRPIPTEVLREILRLRMDEIDART